MNVQELEAMVGMKVKGKTLPDMGKPTEVSGILVQPQTVLGGMGFAIETEDKRHHRFDADTVQLLPENGALEAALAFDAEEADMLRTLLQSLITPWHLPGVFGFIASTIGPEKAQEFLIKLGFGDGEEDDAEPSVDTKG